MPDVILTFLGAIDGYKTYAWVILAIVTGMGLILSKDYGPEITDILRALLVMFSGASVASLRHAVAKVMSKS
jgi:hypothetical protein